MRCPSGPPVPQMPKLGAIEDLARVGSVLPGLGDPLSLSQRGRHLALCPRSLCLPGILPVEVPVAHDGGKPLIVLAGVPGNREPADRSLASLLAP